MFYYSEKSKAKVIHLAGCSHINGIKRKNLVCVDTFFKAKKDGYRLCSCCNPVFRMIRGGGREFKEYCRKNGICCRTGEDGSVSFSTFYSRWILQTSAGGAVCLYHANTAPVVLDRRSRITGYHFQHFRCESALGVAEYIIDHDRFRKENPIAVRSEKKPPKAPSPKKGTKAWRKEQKILESREKRSAVQNVFRLFDELEGKRVTVI